MESYEKFNQRIFDIIEEFQDRIGPLEQASILINLGCRMCYECAPTIEIAEKVIEETRSIAYKDFMDGQ